MGGFNKNPSEQTNTNNIMPSGQPNPNGLPNFMGSLQNNRIMNFPMNTHAMTQNTFEDPENYAYNTIG